MTTIPEGTTLPRGIPISERYPWPLVRIGDLVSLRYGKALPEPTRRPGEVRVFGSNGQCGWHDKALAEPPGVVLGRKGQGPLGVEWVEDPFWVIDTAYWAEVDTNRIDLKFFYYATKFVGLNHLKDGTSNPSLTRERFGSQAFPLPNLPEQRRIVALISSYDALIASNQKRIRVLEEMARSLYREWFIKFRYPNHEAVKLIDSASELGAIPQGWQIKSVEESFAIRGGGTPSRKESEYWDGGFIQWFAPNELTRAGTLFMDDSSEHITELGLKESSARLFPAFCVMMTSRATIGATAINTHEACVNQGFIVSVPNERVPLYFLFHWIKENVSLFERLATGATFKEISRGVFKTIAFVHPPEQLVRRFETFASSVGEQLLVLQRKVSTLRIARDLLLPRLLSGELDVSRIPDPAEVAEGA